MKNLIVYQGRYGTTVRTVSASGVSDMLAGLINEPTIYYHINLMKYESCK